MGVGLVSFLGFPRYGVIN